MLLKILAKKLDHLFCYYLGIHKEKMRLHSLYIKNNTLVVIYAFPFKRHIFKETSNNFNLSDLIKLYPKINDKIGLAAGKSIAKGLVISFEEVNIDPTKSE